MNYQFTSMLCRGLGALMALCLSACALAPAKVQRVETSTVALEQSLGVLLGKALKDEHALAHFVERWKDEHRGESEGEVEMRLPDGSPFRYQVRFKGSVHGGYPLSYFDEISPADDFRVRRIEHYRRDGAGAPLVAVRENRQREAIEKFYPPEAITRPLTAIITSYQVKPGGAAVEITLACPLQNEALYVDGQQVSLAADFTVPWAALLARAGDLSRSRYADPLFRTKPSRPAQLYLMEPYDPDKEPLILIHGLLDTPLVWAKLSNELWADEEIRGRYQIWHYLYNTSAPALYSGRILRTQLRQLRAMLDPTGRDKAMRSTTVIAHSMGGIVTRSLITRPGNAFGDAAFTRPIDALTLSTDDRGKLKEAFFWEPERHVKRVVYIAVPHRGSHHADKPLGRLGRKLVKPPNHFAEFYGRISTANPGAFTEAYEALGSGKLDSVHALSPRQPTLKILADLPNSHSVLVHSIIADRGRKGPLEESSDGVVEYWSSHLDYADSEFIAHCGHYAMEDPAALAEIKRILTLP